MPVFRPTTSALGGSRTHSVQIRSLVLVQLSFECMWRRTTGPKRRDPRVRFRSRGPRCSCASWRLEHGASRPGILVLTALPDDGGMRSDDGFHRRRHRTHDHARPPLGDWGAGGGGPVGHDEVLLRAPQVVNEDRVDSSICEVDTAKVVDLRQTAESNRPLVGAPGFKAEWRTAAPSPASR